MWDPFCVINNKIGSSDFSRSISEVKEFYKRTFYREAPIPVALQLGQPNSKYSFQNNNFTRNFIEKEMEMYFNSGVSVVIRQVLSFSWLSISPLKVKRIFFQR